MPPPTPSDGSDSGFSDSDQAWWDRLSGRGSLAPPTRDAEREADALRRLLAHERQRQPVEADTAAEPELDPAGRDARWQRTRARLQQEGLLEKPAASPTGRQDTRWSGTRWKNAGWGAALAAGLVAALVFVVPPPGDELGAYGEPPAMRSAEVELRRLPVAAPRAEAEALVRVLREAGAKAALYQRGPVYTVDTTVDGASPAAARAALQTLGVQTQAGSVRLEFVPR